MTDSPADRERVRGRIGEAVMSFIASQRGPWHMADLVRYCTTAMDARGAYVAPDSPSRILRLLASDNLVEYRVLNRRASLYTARLVPQQGSLTW